MQDNKYNLATYKFYKGQQVHHDYFGVGRVYDITPRGDVEVHFDAKKRTFGKLSVLTPLDDFNLIKPKIYTHLEAAHIISIFEDLLDRYDIHVPSPEDDTERESSNWVGLYGTTYSELLDDVEASLCKLLDSQRIKYIPHVFND